MVPKQCPRYSRAFGSRATGAFCAWDGANLTVSKLSFTSCSTDSTSWLSVVRSIADASEEPHLPLHNVFTSSERSVSLGLRVEKRPAVC